jgi:hypothetical protein
VVIKVAQQASHRSAVVETSDGREVEAMKLQGQGEESGVEGEREAEAIMNFTSNSSIKHVRIGAQERLKGEKRPNLRHETLNDETAQEGEAGTDKAAAAESRRSLQVFFFFFFFRIKFYSPSYLAQDSVYVYYPYAMAYLQLMENQGPSGGPINPDVTPNRR